MIEFKKYKTAHKLYYDVGDLKRLDVDCFVNAANLYFEPSTLLSF